MELGFTFIIYRETAHIIAKPLAYLYNVSIDEGHVPLAWKEAKKVALPKCKRAGLNDLRPISLLPTPVKILETLILKNFEVNFVHYYGAEQFGF